MGNFLSTDHGRQIIQLQHTLDQNNKAIQTLGRQMDGFTYQNQRLQRTFEQQNIAIQSIKDQQEQQREQKKKKLRAVEGRRVQTYWDRVFQDKGKFMSRMYSTVNTVDAVQMGSGIFLFGTLIVKVILSRRNDGGCFVVNGALLCNVSVMFGTVVAKGIFFIREAFKSSDEDFLLPTPWRPIHQTEKNMSKIKNIYLGKICNIHNPRDTKLNILLLGQAGSGKSSFVNTCQTALIQESKICAAATVLEDTSSSVSTKLQAYRLRVKDGNEQKELPVRLFDCRGLLDDTNGVTTEDIISICDGHIKDNYQIKPKTPIHPNDPKFRANPGQKDKMHCVVYVLDAQNEDEFVQQNVEEQFEKVKQHLIPSNTPQLILVTKVDRLGVRRIGAMFYDKRVKECCENASCFLGLPLYCVLPQANYHDNFLPEEKKDLITILNIWTILERATAYVQEVLDETESARM